MTDPKPSFNYDGVKQFTTGILSDSTSSEKTRQLAKELDLINDCSRIFDATHVVLYGLWRVLYRSAVPITLAWLVQSFSGISVEHLAFATSCLMLAAFALAWVVRKVHLSSMKQLIDRMEGVRDSFIKDAWSGGEKHDPNAYGPTNRRLRIVESDNEVHHL